MTFPGRAVEIVRALYTASPQDDTARRIDIQQVGEQLAFSLGPSWGNKKRAGLSDDFRSPDSIAFLEADGTVSVWDVQASSGAILVHDGKPPDHPNLPPSEATFMSCEPVNHLGGEPLPGEVPPIPGTTLPTSGAVDLTPVLAAFAELKALVEQLRDRPAPTVTFPVYEGEVAIRYLPTGRATLRPKA